MMKARSSPVQGSHSLGKGERTVDLSSSSIDAHEFAKEMVLGPWHG